MEWTRVSDELIVGEWPDEKGVEELAEAGVRDFIEAKRRDDRHLPLGAGERLFRLHRLVVNGWSVAVFEQFAHEMQTGEPGPAFLAARHPQDGQILAWVWLALRSRRPFGELRDRAAKEGVRLPDGAWEFLARQMSRDVAAPP